MSKQNARPLFSTLLWNLIRSLVSISLLLQNISGTLPVQASSAGTSAHASDSQSEPTPTATPSPTQTETAIMTATPTASSVATDTATATLTPTPTFTPTQTATSTVTPTPPPVDDLIITTNTTLSPGDYHYNNLIITNNATLLLQGNPNTGSGVTIQANSPHELRSPPRMKMCYNTSQPDEHRGRFDNGAQSLSNSQTRIPAGTAHCAFEHAGQNLTFQVSTLVEASATFL